MPTEFTGRFDCAELLLLSLAKASSDNHLGLENDEQLALVWDVPYGSQQECVDWLYANRITISNFDVGFKNYADLYRTVSITAEPVVDRAGSITGARVRHSIAKGWYTSIPSDPSLWVNARLKDSETAEGNATSVAGTASADNEAWYTIEFPYCDPASVDAMCKSLNYGLITQNIVVRGQSLGTGLSTIVSSHRVEEDKSRTISLIVARPEYVLQAFSDLTGPNQEDIFYAWNIPKANAQDLIDAFKALNGTGSSASASYNEGQKLVDIVFSKKALAKPNLSIDSLPISCDTTQSMHFAWGYEKADIPAFIANHDDPITTGSRQIQVNQRGDGLYDITIIETLVVASTPPHFAITTLVGDKIEVYEEYGWNISYSQLVTVKATIQAIAAAANKSHKFQLTREDNCTFDYTAQIVTKDANIAELTLVKGATGVGIVSSAFVNGTSTDLGTVSASHAPGVRKRTQVDLSPQEDGLLNAKIETTDVQKTVGSLVIDNKTILFGANADELPIVGDNYRLEGGSVNPKDDGAIDYTLQLKDVDNPNVGEAEVPAGETYGISVYTKAVEGADQAYVDANIIGSEEAGARERISVDVTPNNDGTLRAQINKSIVQAIELTTNLIEEPQLIDWGLEINPEAPPETTDSGKSLVIKFGKNVTQEQFAAAVAEVGTGRNEKYSVSISGNDDGTIDYSISKQVLVSNSATITSGRRTWIFGGRQNSVLKPTSLYTIDSASVNLNDDGTLDSAIAAAKVPYAPDGTYVINGYDSNQYIRLGFCKTLTDVPTSGEYIAPFASTVIAGPYDTNAAIEIDDSGTIRYRISTVEWKIPADMQGTLTVGGVGVYQKRQKVIRKTGTKLYLLNQKRLITKLTERTYSLTHPDPTISGEVEVQVGKLGNLWYTDTTSVTIGEWTVVGNEEVDMDA